MESSTTKVCTPRAIINLFIIKMLFYLCSAAYVAYGYGVNVWIT